MTLLERYIWKNALSGILIAWIALVTLDSFFGLINELGDVSDTSNYRAIDAVLYTIYSLPQRFYEYFPSSILVGALLGLGRLSSNSEFTAMRAAGISIKKIVFATVQLGVVMALFTFVLGEWVVPVTDNYAQSFKAQRKANNVTLSNDRSLWVKEGNEIIFIQKVIANDQLSDVNIYRLGDGYKNLEDITTITSARFHEGVWELTDVTTRRLTGSAITIDRVKSAISQNLINPELLDVAVAEPDQLSSKELKKLILHQQDNGLSAKRFELAYWKHYSIPLSALVMLILALPFIFTSQRSANVGQQIFIGITVGIGFYLINRVLNELGSVFGFSPVISAFLPVLLFFGISLLALRRVA